MLVGIVSYIPWLGSYGPLDPTDSFFLESGRESVETNQYLLPLNNYVPWLDKPILFFWLVALSYKLFGISTFTGRLPAALSAIATGLLIYAGSRPMLRKRTAALAAIIFLCNPLSSIIGHVCLTDMTLCALLTGSILFLFKGMHYCSARDLIIAYTCLAFAVLNKGPIAIILCGLVFLPYMILESINKKRSNDAATTSGKKVFIDSVLAIKPALGIAIVLLVNLPWYIAASLATEGRFLYAFFWQQNFGRMVGTVNHQGPFWFYIPVYFCGLFPWSVFSIAAPGLLKSAWTKRTQSNAAASQHLRLFLRLVSIWFVVVLGLFSIIKTKLPTYILPAIPAFAILIALQLESFLKQSLKQKLAPSIIVTLVVAIGLSIAPFVLKGYVRDIAVNNMFLLAPMAIALSFYWMGIVRKKIAAPLWSLVLCALLACAVVVPRGLQAFYQARQIGFSSLVMKAEEAKASVAMISAEEPSVPWLTHRPVSRLLNDEDARKYIESKPAPHFVLVPREMLARMDWFSSTHTLLGESGKWYLFSVNRAN